MCVVLGVVVIGRGNRTGKAFVRRLSELNDVCLSSVLVFQENL